MLAYGHRLQNNCVPHLLGIKLHLLTLLLDGISPGCKGHQGQSLAGPSLADKFALSQLSERLWASHLALQTSDFWLFNSGREPNLDSAQGGGRGPALQDARGGSAGAQRAGRASELCPERGAETPRGRGRELPLRERIGGAPPLSSTSRAPRGALPPTVEGEQLPRMARRRGGEGGGRSAPPPRQRGREPRTQLAAPAGRPLQPRGPRVRGCPAPFRKSIWSRKPIRTARGRGAGLLSWLRGGRDARTRPSPPRDFHFPAGENLGAASLSGTGVWGAALGSRAELRPGPVAARLHASRGAGAGTGRADRQSRTGRATPSFTSGRRSFGALRGGRTLQSSPRPALGTRAAGGRRLSAQGGPRRPGRSRAGSRESPGASATGFPRDSARARSMRRPGSRCPCPPGPRAT